MVRRDRGSVIEQVEQCGDVGLRQLQRVVLGQLPGVPGAGPRDDRRHGGTQLVERTVQRHHSTPLPRVRQQPPLRRRRRRCRRRAGVARTLPVSVMT